MNLPALVAFDVDGTLLRGETICECIGRQIGKAAEMRAFERLTSRDEIAAARREMATWYRPYTRQALLDCLQTVRLAPGARKGFAQLREAGVKTALVSITWSFAVEWLAKELGADFAVGTDWLDTGEVADFWPDDKAIWLEQLMRRLNIAREAVAVVGDSAGDIPMLKLAGRGYFVGAAMPGLPPHVQHYPGASIDVLVGAMSDRITPPSP
jgi:HAD superfamily phosphoserine phosphatase-like hydrolase